MPGGEYMLDGEKNYVLLSHALTGTTWLFDAASNTNATVLSSQIETIFGNPDSVKTIALSNGLLFKLSKSFGLLSFPENDADDVMELVGIEDSNLGESLPTYRNIFDYQPGDVFQYDEESFMGIQSKHEMVKHTIIEREDIANTIHYKIKRNRNLALARSLRIEMNELK